MAQEGLRFDEVDTYTPRPTSHYSYDPVNCEPQRVGNNAILYTTHLLLLPGAVVHVRRLICVLKLFIN